VKIIEIEKVYSNRRCNTGMTLEGRMESLEEGIRMSKELGGSARQCHVARIICLEIEGCIFGGALFGLPRSRLGPPQHYRVELTTFARQSRMVSKL